MGDRLDDLCRQVIDWARDAARENNERHVVGLWDEPDKAELFHMPETDERRSSIHFLHAWTVLPSGEVLPALQRDETRRPS